MLNHRQESFSREEWRTINRVLAASPPRGAAVQAPLAGAIGRARRPYPYDDHGELNDMEEDDDDTHLRNLISLARLPYCRVTKTFVRAASPAPPPPPPSSPSSSSTSEMMPPDAPTDERTGRRASLAEFSQPPGPTDVVDDRNQGGGRGEENAPQEGNRIRPASSPVEHSLEESDDVGFEVGGDQDDDDDDDDDDDVNNGFNNDDQDRQVAPPEDTSVSQKAVPSLEGVDRSDGEVGEEEEEDVAPNLLSNTNPALNEVVRGMVKAAREAVGASESDSERSVEKYAAVMGALAGALQKAVTDIVKAAVEEALAAGKGPRVEEVDTSDAPPEDAFQPAKNTTPDIAATVLVTAPSQIAWLDEAPDAQTETVTQSTRSPFAASSGQQQPTGSMASVPNGRVYKMRGGETTIDDAVKRRREKDAKRKREALLRESPEKRAKRLDKARAYKKRRLLAESPAEKKRRQAEDAARKAKSRTRIRQNDNP